VIAALEKAEKIAFITTIIMKIFSAEKLPPIF
jgi:hypothetical protein